MKYKALIFDLDGTLLNSIEDIKDSCNEALSYYQLKTFEVCDYKLFVGDGVDMLIKRVLSSQDHHESLFIDVKTRYLETYTLLQHHKTAPYDGIIDLLDFAKNNQINCYVLSNKPHLDTLSVINYFFPENTFNEIVGKKEGYLPKPDPTLLLELIENIPCKSTEILYIGDTYTDMMTAQNGHLISVGVLWGFRDRDELKKGKASYIVSTPNEIISLLKKE
jgi:phosphoglycolate phosphatase